MSNKDKVTALITVFVGFGPIIVTMMFARNILEFMMGGILHSFSIANVSITKRYREYLMRTSQLRKFERIRILFTMMNSERAMTICLLYGVLVGVLMFIGISVMKIVLSWLSIPP